MKMWEYSDFSRKSRLVYYTISLYTESNGMNCCDKSRDDEKGRWRKYTWKKDWNLYLRRGKSVNVR